MSFFKRILNLFSGGSRLEEGVKAIDDDDAPATRPMPVPVKTAPLDPTRLDTAPLDRVDTRRLPPLEQYMKTSGRLLFGQSTDVGKEREENEDALFVMASMVEAVESVPQFGVFAVADGIGGQSGGKQASATAIRVMAKHLTDAFYLPLLDEEKEDDKPIGEVLEAAIEEANQAVKAGSFTEGGTTLTAAVIKGSMLSVVHAGDCRLYLIENSKLKRLTSDHTAPGRLEELGQLTPEEARTHPSRNQIYKALGRNDPLNPDRFTRPLEPGVRLLLCSDGLWGEVDEPTIMGIIDQAPDLQTACDQLVAAANDAGGPDNISVVMVETPEKGS